MLKKVGAIFTVCALSAAMFAQSALAAEIPVYVISANPGATISVIATSGDTIGGQVLQGIPDGMGATVNSDGTITLLSNHEMSLSSAVVQTGKSTTGTWGSSISKLTYDPATSKITKIAPLIKSVQYYDYLNGTWGSDFTNSVPSIFPKIDSYGGENGTNGLNRFCSGNLVAAGGLSYKETVDAKTTKKVNGKNTVVTTKKTTTYGYSGAVYFTGEEGGDASRAFAFDLDGNGIQLPRLGLAAWENFLTKPNSGKYTIVMGNEDNGATNSQLYMYVGTKQASGANFAEKAGLTNGKLYTASIANLLSDTAFRAAKKVGEKVDVGFNEVSTDPRFSNFANQSQASGTSFARIEDGEWDPKNPNVYYFLTTESNKDPLATTPNPENPGSSRDGGALWRLTFKDAKNPFAGAQIEMLLNGAESIFMSKPDNLAIDESGYVLIQEDPGSNAHLARVIAYRISDGKLATVAQFDGRFFKTGTSDFITIDEESSGIVNVNKFMKKSGDNASYFFFNAQVHSTLALARPDLAAGLSATDLTSLNNAGVEGGQYYTLKIDWTKLFA
ncbi:MAG: alkaline phosphatase PhoX [Candidatus Nanopelagicaceae bacterium]